MSGILLLVAGLWTLSSLDASGKYLVMAGVPVLMLTWVRYVVHTFLLTAVLLPRRGRALFHTRSLPRQLQRGALMVLGSVLFFTVLGRLPLAEATALNFLAPLFVMALAPWLLHEPHRLHRWLGVLLGFAGMVIVVRPGSPLDPVGVALGVACAVTFAAFHIATRRVAHDDTMTTNIYGGVCGTLSTTLGLPWFWEAPDLSGVQWLLLLSTGVSGMVGHGLQAAAYRRTPATLLAPYGYLQIVAAVSLGWWAFGQLPDRTTAWGIALICAAGVGVALTEAWVSARRAGAGALNAVPAGEPGAASKPST